MYWRPSSSVSRLALPSRRKTGVPPTARKARTGEFTPPGISASERSNRLRLRSYIVGSVRRIVEVREASRGEADVGRIEEGRDHGDHLGAGSDHGCGIV